MDKSKVQKISQIMRGIERCEDFLKSLKDRSYEDEFDIYYRDFKTCELEPEARELLIKHYEDKLQKFNEELKKM